MIIKKEYNANEVLYKDFFKWIIRIVIAISIMYSYFHSLPFPLDKPLILVASSIYFLFEGILLIYEKFIL